jgi:large subunit ribosomal protein L25
MMEKIVINAVKRTIKGKQVGTLRREGKLPGVIYGHKLDPIAIVMDLKESTHFLNSATSSSIIQVNVEGTEYATLVREKQHDYLKNRLIHVDFQAVSQTEKIRANVGIEFINASPAVKDYSAVIVEGMTEIAVEALPKDLPERFVIDLALLKQISDAVYVKDLVIPANVIVLSPAEEMVVMAAAPALEEVEPVAAATEETAAEPEVIEKGKKEEEVPE